jgi:tetratricopeptide (TPR) repeat protein
MAVVAGEVVRDDGEKSKKTAKEYFERGERLFETGEYAGAAELFVLAYEESPHPIVLANIALSYDRAGRLPQAVTTYREYLANHQDSGMQSRLDELEKQVGELHITCPERDPCSIKVDGIGRGDTPLVLVVYPGPHKVVATASGHSPVTKKTKVPAGERIDIAIDMGKESKRAPTRKGEKNAPYGLGIGFWTSVGVTGAAGTLAIVFGALTATTKNDFEDSGSTDMDLKEQGEDYRLVTNVMIGVTAAAALTAAGFAIYDLVYKKDKKEKQDRAQVVIVPGPGLGVGAVVTF